MINILWADDEIDLLKPHILYLEGKGYSLTPAIIGNDALDYLKEKSFDLIFLDENMPGLSGLETLAIINENYRFDLLNSVRSTNFFYPEELKSLISDKGNPILKLDKIAPLNGISNFKAHDAKGDTFATLELAKIIRGI